MSDVIFDTMRQCIESARGAEISAHNEYLRLRAAREALVDAFDAIESEHAKSQIEPQENG